VSPKRLPLVLPPITGESLSGWVLAMADAYGITWSQLLRSLDLPAPVKLRRLSIAPGSAWLAQLAGLTGLDADQVERTMTLCALAPDLISFVDAAEPCPECSVTQPPGRWRPVEWLSDLAPWTMQCVRVGCHPPCSPLGSADMAARMSQDLQLFSTRVRLAAPYSTTRLYPNAPVSLAGALGLVRTVNGRMKLCCSMEAGGPVMFEVMHVPDAIKIGRGSTWRQANDRAVSAWFVWHVLTSPTEVFWRNMRCRDAGTVYDVLTLVFDPAQMGIVSPQWDFAMSLSRAATTAPTKSSDEAAQAAKVAGAARLCVAGRNPCGTLTKRYGP